MSGFDLFIVPSWIFSAFLSRGQCCWGLVFSEFEFDLRRKKSGLWWTPCFMSHEYEMFLFERSRGHMICDMPALILVTVKHFQLSSLNVNIFNCLSLYVELWCMEIIDNSRGIQHNSRFLLCRYAFGKKFISIFSVSKKTHISPERYILRLLNLLTVECPCKTISSCQTCFQKKTPLYGFTKPYSFHFPRKLSLQSLKKFHAPRN